jgi:hypothetical protein
MMLGAVGVRIICLFMYSVIVIVIVIYLLRVLHLLAVDLCMNEKMFRRDSVNQACEQVISPNPNKPFKPPTPTI